MIHWPEIVETHGPLVWQVIYRLIGHRETAADCYQETFLAALRLAESRDVQNWQALLRTLATRKAIDALRARYRSRDRTTPLIVAEHDDQIPPDITDHADALRWAELRDAVRDILATLPARQAEAFALRHFQEMTDPEIATQLDTTPRNVGVLVHRAAKKLREKLPPSLRQNATRIDPEITSGARS